MSVTRDSIQTLLKQRRELRDCLSELRQEIGALKSKADTMVDGEKSEANGPAMPEIEQAPAEEIGTTEQTATQAPAVSFSMRGKISNRSGTDETAPQEIAPREERPSPPPAVSETEPVIEKRVLKEPKTIPTAEKVASPEHVIPKEIIPEAPSPDSKTEISSPTIPNEAEEISPSPTAETIDEKAPSLQGRQKQLYEEAVQLTRFFLHQPAPSADEKVDLLEAAIEGVDRAASRAEQKVAYQHLREAYRDLLKLTYPQYRVSGRSILHSEGPVSGLFFVPFLMAVLILLLQPGLYLLRYFSPDLLEGRAVFDMVYYLGYLLAFIWGMSGGLFYHSLRTVRAVHGKRYDRCHFRGGGLIGFIAGLLGLISPMLIQIVLPSSGLVTDLITGGMAFSIGFIWSVLFHWLADSPPKPS